MKDIVHRIEEEITSHNIRDIQIMEVCGTHTMAIARAGIRSILPEAIRLLSGPGCPVCVTPQVVIDQAIALAQIDGVIVATFGDMVRVPGSETSLEPYRPKIVYSVLDALTIAEEHPDNDVVFIGVGFETTSPTVAATVLAAEKKKVGNFYVLPAFKIIPPALEYIARSPKINIHGLILPGHVSTIIGSQPYSFLAETYKIPGCVTGFDPADILQGILDLVKQIAAKTAAITIEYTRVVKPEGNQHAQHMLEEVFKTCDAQWRGVGVIPASGLTFNDQYGKYDVSTKYTVSVKKSPEPKGCLCGQVLLGMKHPFECSLFAKQCTPFSPVGPCMVSSEGSCAAYYKYGYKEKQ